MKHALFIIPQLAVALALSGQTLDYRITRTLASPSGAIVAAVAVQDTRYGPLFSLGSFTNGSFQPFAELPPSIYSREYHGSDWFNSMPERWIDDRFLVFADEYGLATADVQSRRMLLDHVFMAYAKSPTADEWAAIRFRPTGRMQEQLEDNFQDTLLLIDPVYATTHIREASESNFVGQLQTVQPGGVILAKPEWASDGSSIAVLTWKKGTVAAVRYDRTLRETARTMVKLGVGRQSALSTGLKKDLAPIAKRILSDPTTFQSAYGSPAP
jgi:hypothetical protein